MRPVKEGQTQITVAARGPLAVGGVALGDEGGVGARDARERDGVIGAEQANGRAPHLGHGDRLAEEVALGVAQTPALGQCRRRARMRLHRDRSVVPHHYLARLVLVLAMRRI